MKKVALVGYFVVLFLIMGSYIYYSDTTHGFNLRVSTSDGISTGQGTLAAVWATSREGAGYDFEGYGARASWISTDDGTPVGRASVADLDGGGFAILKIPTPPDAPVRALKFELIRRPDDETVRSGLIAASSFNRDGAGTQAPHEYGADVDADVIEVRAPGAFIDGTPNDVTITAFDSRGPIEGFVDISQIYGTPAVYQHRVRLDPSGVTRTAMRLTSPADFKFDITELEGEQSQDVRTVYATFSLYHVPIHAHTDVRVLTPQDAPKLTVVPVSSMPTIYVDYFDTSNGWFDRQIFPPSTHYPAALAPKYKFGSTPALIYARVSASAFAKTEDCQIIPLIASPGRLTKSDALKTAARLAGQYAPRISSHPMLNVDGGKIMHKGHADYRTAEILDLAARDNAPALNITTRLRTKAEDAEESTTRRAAHKHTANIALTFWFGLGFAICAISASKTAYRRRKYWQSLGDDGIDGADLPEHMPRQNPMVFLLLTVLMIGMFVSIYFMMQLL